MDIVPIELERVELITLKGEALVLKVFDLPLEPLTIFELDPVKVSGTRTRW